MGKYIDLCTVIDVEPEVSQVLGLIEDEDLLSESGREWMKISLESLLKITVRIVIFVS